MHYMCHILVHILDMSKWSPVSVYCFVNSPSVQRNKQQNILSSAGSV